MQTYESVPQFTLSEALQAITVDELRTAAKTLGVKQSLPNRKADIVTHLKSHLQTKHLKQYWEQLSEDQKNVVSESVHNGNGCFKRRSFEAKYGTIPSWGLLDRYSSFDTEDCEATPLAVFFYRDVLPMELYKRFLSFVPKPKEMKLETVKTLPEKHEVKREFFDYKKRESVQKIKMLPISMKKTEVFSLEEVKVVLNLINTKKISVSDKTGFPTKSSLKTLSSNFKEDDFYDQDTILETGAIKPFGWLMLIQASSLTKTEGKNLKLTKKGVEALKKEAHEVIKELFEDFIESQDFDEFRRIDVIKGQNLSRRYGITRPSDRRLSLIGALKECQTEEWVYVDSFFKFIQSTEYDFEIASEAALWELYICEKRYGSLGYSGFGGWEIVQARYTLCFLFEYLATLGLIDIAVSKPNFVRKDYGDLWGMDDLDYFSRYDGLIYFSINELGKYCLGLSDSYENNEPEGESLFKVLPNFEVVATEKIPIHVEINLNYYLKKKTSRVWQIDSETIISCLEKGHKLDNIIRFLTIYCENRLPDTIVTFFEDLSYKTTSLKSFGEAKLIECENQKLALTFANDSDTKRYCQLAGDRSLVYLLKDEKKFLKGLRKKGYIVNP